MKALVTGCVGQDGSYLCELLLSKGYEVHGLIRRSTAEDLQRAHLPGLKNVIFHYADMTDYGPLASVIRSVQPDLVFNLAAQSHVAVSFQNPVYTFNVNALGANRLLEAIREHCPKARFYQASTSEMFGLSPSPQNEETPLKPQSPYAISKCAAHYSIRVYREAYKMFVVSGILFNHESPRRGSEFVTRKITKALARIKYGKQEKLKLGNLEAKRDWGYAPDYVSAMIQMLEQDVPSDYVIATGEQHTVLEFLELAAEIAEVELPGHLEIDSSLMRPAEVPDLRGDASKARKELGWKPTISFEELVRKMVEHDLEVESH